MAYRQLFAVSFAVLGLFAVGCGGDTTSAGGTPSASDASPANKDQPPGSGSDQTPPSSDRVPGNADAPPASADAPAGSGDTGQLVDLCQRLCGSIQTAVDQCSMGMSMAGIGDLCSAKVSCQVPASYPCVTEVVGLLDCFIANFGALCGGKQAQADFCSEQQNAVTSCTKTNGLDTAGSGGNDNGSGGGPSTAAACTSAGKCKCPDDCTTCTCKAGTDLTKLSACATSSSCM